MSDIRSEHPAARVHDDGRMSRPTRRSPATTRDDKTPDPRALRLQRREQIRQRVLDASAGLVEQHPWSAITVDDITSASGLSRTAFYQHFADKQELLLVLLAGLSQEVERVGDEWNHGGEDPIAELERSVALVVDMFVSNGRLYKAVADAAVSEPVVADAWAALVGRIVSDTADGIRRDRVAGHSNVTDPDGLAQALTWMNERYLLRCFGQHPLADPDAVSATIGRIWVRSIYDIP